MLTTTFNKVFTEDYKCYAIYENPIDKTIERGLILSTYTLRGAKKEPVLQLDYFGKSIELSKVNSIIVTGMKWSQYHT